MKKLLLSALVLIPLFPAFAMNESQKTDTYIIRKREGQRKYDNKRAEKKAKYGHQNPGFKSSSQSEPYSPTKK